MKRRLLALSGLLLITAPLARAEKFALLVNGGNGGDSNHCSFYHDIKTIKERLGSSWTVSELAGDGDGTSPGTESPDAVKCDGHGGDSVERTADGSYVLTNTIEPGAKPATEAELSRWFKEISRKSKPGDTVLVYFTDHGTDDAAGSEYDRYQICLWERCITTREYRRLLALIPTDRKVISVNDHCDSGGALRALFDSSGPGGRPVSNRCGFAAAAPEEIARFDTYTVLLAKSKAPTLYGQHLETVQSDDLIQLPETTSDIFLENLLKRRGRQSNVALASCRVSDIVSGEQLASLSTTEQAVLSERLAQLASLLPQGTTSVADVDGQLATYERGLSKAAAALDAAKVDYNKARSRYVAVKKPAEWKRVQEVAATIDALEASGLYEKAAELRLKNMRDANTVYALREALDGNPKFPPWLKANAKREGFSADCVARYQAASDAFDKVTQGSVKLRRMAHAVHGLRALHDLFSRGTPEEKRQYLDLISCENTAI